MQCSRGSLLGARGDRGEVADNDELLHSTDLLRQKRVQRGPRSLGLLVSISALALLPAFAIVATPSTAP